MCTRILWTGMAGDKFSSVCGRNMDWGFDMEEKLWVFPAGLKRKSEVKGKFIGWTSKYGSIAASVYDQATSDGMNTEGLAIHANWLTEAYYGERDESKPGLDGNRGLQYFLDNFATVREVVEHLEKNKDLQFVPTKVKKGSLEQEVQCHLAMEDAQGESVIIEYLKNGDSVERNIYYSGDIPNYSMEYNVLTNSPPFKEQLLNLQKYEGFGGYRQDLPGTTAAADRFVRGAFYLKSLPKPANQREAIAGVLSVMRSTAQPFRVPDPNKPYASSTRWRTVAALTEKLYLYESSLYPTLIWLDAKNIDFNEDSGVRVFDLAKNREAIGDVSDKLTPAEDLFGNNISTDSLHLYVRTHIN